MKKDETLSRLYDGTPVPKTDPRMEANGTIDELNCHIGLLTCDVPDDFRKELHDIQRRLFGISAIIADAPNPKNVPGEEETARLRTRIAEMEIHTGGFRGFVLPGGCRAAAQAHVCRAVCRRAERRVIATGHEELVPYLNRLSGYFFVLAKLLNNFYNSDEIIL